MTTKAAKRKATIALQEIIKAARKYVQAECEVQQAMKEEAVQLKRGRRNG